MRECVDLILQNEYYLRNQKKLVDWARLTQNDIKFSIEVLKRIDFRGIIFETTR